LAPGVLIHINGRPPAANDCIAISWAGLRIELIFVKTPWLLMADKLPTKENSHAYGYPGRFCQDYSDRGGAAAAA
jgi:hypothetical protein